MGKGASATKSGLRDRSDPGRYRKISTRLWNDRRFLRLSPPPPCGRYLVLFLLTSPATGSVPGLFRARETALAEELGWTLEGFRQAFAEAKAQGLVEADWKAGLVWLPNAINDDPPASANVVKGWGRVVRNEMVECALLGRALLTIRTRLGELFQRPSPFVDAFDAAFPPEYMEGFAQDLPEALVEAYSEALGEPGYRIPESRVRIPDTKREPPAASAGADTALSERPREAVHKGEASQLPPRSDSQGQQTLSEVVPDPVPATHGVPGGSRKKPGAGGDAPPSSVFVQARDRLGEVFAEVRGVEYAFQGAKDGLALNWLLYGSDRPSSEVKARPPRVDVPEIERRFRIGLAWKGFPSCNGIHDLRHHWNTYTEPQQQPPHPGSRPGAPRNVRTGVVRAEDCVHPDTPGPIEF